MKNFFFVLTLLCSFTVSQAQIVSLSPSNAGADDAVTLTFNAAEGNGELVGASTVYLHHGAVVEGPASTNWQYVIGNWGEDDGIGEMTPVAGQTDVWEIEFTPTMRDYFGVPNGENIFRISAVFRSADGSTKGTMAPGAYGWGTVADNQDMYIDLNISNYISLLTPQNPESFIFVGQPIVLAAEASSNVSSMKLWVDEGSGYQEIASVSSGTSINYPYMPSESGLVQIKVTATVNGEELEVIRDHNVVIVTASSVVPLPPGVVAGINYHDDDNTKATLVLEAPGKPFVYLAGDFNDWLVSPDYQMNRTPNGQYFWYELTDLTPQQEYVFQYWVEGTIRVGDPYADKVADPWNDPYIDESTYPNLPLYDEEGWGIATVLQTGQTPYVWAASEDTWERPNIDHLTIYELLIRDFGGEHSYKEMRDTLAYIANLGVDAIEIMPFNEFEGNESWGYNPNYFFAPDKYYGPKDELKKLIEAAHEMGLAVIMDIVMNHAYGTCPMVKMFFDEAANRPSLDNPWFNRDYVGQYQWGYDWDHESTYTQEFLDRLNAYWINEYHIDGYRFDFTKGFTNNAPNGSVDGFDQSRIDILKRMADEIWDVDSDAYIILEHWGPWEEENILGDYGMKMWRNRSYDFVPAVVGQNSGNFNDMDATRHISFFDSHDERRIAEHALTEGQAIDNYDVKNPLVMFERMKLAAAFAFLSPGPKMMWQFDELGYDIDINFNGRIGNKPLPWGSDGLGYYEDPLRRYIYDAYAGILDVRNQLGAENLNNATKNHQLSGQARRLSYNMSGTDLVLVGNFGLSNSTINPEFTQTGTWYDYFSGESITVTNPTSILVLEPGEWHIYTSDQLSEGQPGVVEIYSNPVTITPYPFTKDEQITIRFEAEKAFPNGTAGLVGSDKVYMHSGVVLENASSTTLANIVGTFQDDGLGEMTEVSEDIWEITLTPADYYSLTENQEAFKIGMWFRDANNTNEGYGFRNTVVYVNIDSDLPFITIDPPAFTIDDEIRITFNALKGNGELANASKVYMHSSVDLTDTTTPWDTGWNNVIGNWGQDDGVGEMAKVAGEDNLWEITLTPRNYYGLTTGDVVYWIPAVFRSANGNIKGTGAPGPLPNGFIHTNQDFFLHNDIIISTKEQFLENGKMSLYPNPTASVLTVELVGISGDYQLELLNINGQVLKTSNLQLQEGELSSQALNLENLPAGIYLVKLTGEGQVGVQRVVKQ